MTALAATVGGAPVSVDDVDTPEARLRAGPLAAAVLNVRAGLNAVDVPTEAALLPDEAARLEIGSVAAAALADPLARALFAHVTAGGTAPPLGQVQALIAQQLRGAARRRAFRAWLDARRAELGWLAPGDEHPGDPHQPDPPLQAGGTPTHRH